MMTMRMLAGYLAERNVGVWHGPWGTHTGPMSADDILHDARMAVDDISTDSGERVTVTEFIYRAYAYDLRAFSS